MSSKVSEIRNILIQLLLEEYTEEKQRISSKMYNSKKEQKEKQEETCSPIGS